MQKRKFLFIVFAFAISTICSVALADELKGARAALIDINTVINEGVKKTEKSYEENNGGSISAYSLINIGQNQHLSAAYVDTDYKVVLRFASRRISAESGTPTTVPTAASLDGRYITLIPIYASSDEKITSWECYTNFDDGIGMFMGDAGTKEYSASVIRNYSDNPYLSACTYIQTFTINGILDPIPIF